MERYTSKQEQVLKSASMIYKALSNFDNLTPVLAGKVDGWEATGDTCSFKVKGFHLHMRIVERQEHKLIKITHDEGSPLHFTFFFQLVAVTPNDTRIRVVLDAKLNAMMKMMLGKKLAQAVDQIVETIAKAFNQLPETDVNEMPVEEFGAAGDSF